MPRLFRQEAIDALRERALGDVSAANPLPTRVFTLVIAATLLSILSYAAFGRITRFERVSGYVEIQGGTARILADSPGTITGLMISEGTTVVAGDSIATISYERRIASGGASELIGSEIESRIEGLKQAAAQNHQLLSLKRDQLRSKVTSLQVELTQLRAEEALQADRVQSAAAIAERYASLASKDVMSKTSAQQKQDDLRAEKLRQQSMSRDATRIIRERSDAAAELSLIEVNARIEDDRLSRLQSELRGGLVEEQSRRSRIIRAPLTGTVTNIAVSMGSSVAEDQLLVSIVPKDARLYARMVLPSRAMAYVKAGDRALLRYESFPYQQFGQYGATVQVVGQTGWLEGDKIGPLETRQTVFTVHASLDSQYVVGPSGAQLPLRPGMALEADIQLERISILRWAFQPLFSLRKSGI